MFFEVCDPLHPKPSDFGVVILELNPETHMILMLACNYCSGFGGCEASLLLPMMIAYVHEEPNKNKGLNTSTKERFGVG